MTDRELTDALAERVMGWELDMVTWRGRTEGEPYLRWTGENVTERDWRPLTDMNHAMELVEAMHARHRCEFIDIMFAHEWTEDGEKKGMKWTIYVSGMSSDENDRETPIPGLTSVVVNDPDRCRGLCLAIARAVGIEVGDA